MTLLNCSYEIKIHLQAAWWNGLNFFVGYKTHPSNKTYIGTDESIINGTPLVEIWEEESLQSSKHSVQPDLSSSLVFPGTQIKGVELSIPIFGKIQKLHGLLSVFYLSDEGVELKLLKTPSSSQSLQLCSLKTANKKPSRDWLLKCLPIAPGLKEFWDQNKPWAITTFPYKRNSKFGWKESLGERRIYIKANEIVWAKGSWFPRIFLIF